jgi:hypothetical protein
MERRETVTMSFFPRTNAGLRPDQQGSHRSMTTVPAKAAPGHSEPDKIAILWRQSLWQTWSDSIQFQMT